MKNRKDRFYFYFSIFFYFKFFPLVLKARLCGQDLFASFQVKLFSFLHSFAYN
jgi:hypothetical protein